MRNPTQAPTATLCYSRIHSAVYSSVYLEECAAGLQGTFEVVGVSAAEAVTANGCPNLLTVGTAESQSAPQSQFHVDEGAGLGLVNLTGPQSTVEVDLRHTTKDLHHTDLDMCSTPDTSRSE